MTSFFLFKKKNICLVFVSILFISYRYSMYKISFSFSTSSLWHTLCFSCVQSWLWKINGQWSTKFHNIRSSLFTDRTTKIVLCFNLIWIKLWLRGILLFFLDDFQSIPIDFNPLVKARCGLFKTSLRFFLLNFALFWTYLMTHSPCVSIGMELNSSSEVELINKPRDKSALIFVQRIENDAYRRPHR